MEILSGETSLRWKEGQRPDERVRGIEPRPTTARLPWKVRSIGETLPLGPAAPAFAEPSEIVGGDQGSDLVGIERRLVRRAEALWDSLRGADALPAAGVGAAALLRPPFASHAMLVTLTSGADPGSPEVGFVGQALQGLVKSGGATEAGVPRLDLRLSALGARAIRSRAPALLDSDDDPPPARPPSADRPHLLLRAIALPLAAGNGDGSAIVVTSWRKLLSSAETAELHRELAAAIDWMHQLGAAER